jgi:excisionase family DNA binding protein
MGANDNKQLAAQPAMERLFTIREIAAAFHVSEETIRLWIKQGDIPYIEVGPSRLKRLRPRDLLSKDAADGMPTAKPKG